MANSRFDNIKYYDGSTFKIPQQIKVYDGSAWVDLGTKDSFNTKKLNAYDGSNFFCATYYRHDVDIPKTIQIGGNKYLYLYKGDGTTCQINSYSTGYVWEMIVEVNETTPLYTCYTKNQGDIFNQAYVNYIAEVSGNSVRLRINSRFNGYEISNHKYINSTLNRYTSYCWTKGEKVRIYLTRDHNSGNVNVKVFNPAGTMLCNDDLLESTQMVWTPNQHRIGCETSNDSGSQNSYGNAKIHYFKFTPNTNRSQEFIINFNNATNGQTTLYSSGSYGGRVDAVNTSVYGSQYTEWIRQTI